MSTHLDASQERLQPIMERGVNVGAIEFTHERIPFSARIDPQTVEYYLGRVQANFVIETKGKKFAEIFGVFEATEDGPQFTVKSSNNLTHPEAYRYNPSLPRVNGLVQKFISEVLQQRVITSWISDVDRTDGANKIYQGLKSDPMLKVTFDLGLNRLLPQNRMAHAYKVTLAA